jgi:uncharacterized membrane protein
MRENIIISPRVRFVMGMEWTFRRWLEIWLVLFTLFNILPYLAPLAMVNSAEPLGNLIYDTYGRISHQFAHRSYFFFGENLMYTPDELPIEFGNDIFRNESMMKAFRGNDTLGWKVAWSDRLVTMYGSALIASWAYYMLRKREGFRPLSRRMMIFLVLPLLIDGTTHYLSDFDGLVTGFRWNNAWLATLTGNVFSESFYVGSGLGSFNSWTRLISGFLFGIGLMGWGLGNAENYFIKNADILKTRLDNWWARQME